jgi:peptidoglycan/xylan/chitin deacetylase (PgdA/CDA1 family)
MEIKPFQIPILTYHKIDIQNELGINVVSPQNFYEQMRFLNEQGYQTITFRDILVDNIPEKPVIITFDDGYSSVYEEALPNLEKFNFTAVIFIITHFVGKWNTWDANLTKTHFRHLNTQQILQLSEYGMEIGSHGMTHRAFTFLNDQIVQTELIKSREKIKDICGKEPITVAYPFGIQNVIIQQKIVEAGYSFGCVNLWGFIKEFNPLCIRRIPVYRLDSLYAFKNKLAKGWKHQIELAKLRTLSSPAFLTPIYQKYFKKNSKPE